MNKQPELKTERLILRPFAMNDAPQVRHLAGEKDIASATLFIPYPYEDGIAEEWIATHQEKFESGDEIIFAIILNHKQILIGAIGMTVESDHDKAELGYWIGKPYWNHGYCTEAGYAILKYAFETLGLNRISARHFARNPASGMVMQKLGMIYEGNLRQDVKKWGKYEDMKVYGILKDDRRLNC